MKIGDILLWMPRTTFLGLVAKIPRFELSEKAKNMVSQKGMYHFVYEEHTADKIIETENLKPSSVFTSYGRKCAFMFCGGPSIDNYAKNLSDSAHITNPYTDPTMVQTAIKFLPDMRDLANYRFRGLTDNVFTYEGTCILPHEKIQKVKMVPDLIRDSEGNPILDKNGEPQAEFREATIDEIMPDGKNYKAKSDYLDYMKKKAIEYGYLNENGEKAFILKRPFVFLNELARMEADEAKKTFSKNAKDIANGLLNKVKGMFNKSALPEATENILDDFSFSKKNPFRDFKFAQKVAKLQAEEGIIQSDLRDMLSEFTQSKDGIFYAKKYNQINGEITRKGIHGKGHTDRVALSAMMIAHNEGVLDNDTDNRIKDILATASMFHDIGRIFDQGPHARRGAKKIGKMDLIYSNGKPYTEEDKALVMALVDAHEGKPDKINLTLKRYGVQLPENIELGKRLNSIIRDADALDRVRIDNNLVSYKVDLNPDFLVNSTSKGMIIQAYQLEYLTQREPNMNNILQFGKRKTDILEQTKEEQRKFEDKLKPEASKLQQINEGLDKNGIIPKENERDNGERG